MPYRDLERQREYQRRWMRQRRADFFAGKCCVDCGSTMALELDHLDPSQKNTHRIWSFSKKRRDAELQLCQVLCVRCHRKKTNRQLTTPLIHGTAVGYKNKGCRCLECCAAHTKWRRKRNRKKQVLSGCGGIGIRKRFKPSRLRDWEFESPQPQKIRKIRRIRKLKL